MANLSGDFALFSNMLMCDIAMCKYENLLPKVTKCANTHVLNVRKRSN